MSARLTIKAVPRASRSEVVERQADAWRVRLKAPPVEGKANEELVKFLAKTLGVPGCSVSLVAGQASKFKLVDIEGLSQAEAESRLGLLLDGKKGASL